MFRRLASALALFAGLTITMASTVFAQQPLQASPPSSTQFDMNQLIGEAQGWLTDLIHMDTSNPPGNELDAAKYVAGILQKENIPAEVIEIAPGRGIVIGRLQLGPLPDASKALLLLAHLDVVGVDKTKWSVDPFGAVVKDGYIYGRGAIDDKGMVAANLATIIALKRAGVRTSTATSFFWPMTMKNKAAMQASKWSLRSIGTRLPARLLHKRRRHSPAEGRQSTVCRYSGKRESAVQCFRHRHGNLRTCICSAAGQRGRTPLLGSAKNRRHGNARTSS